MYVLKGTKVPVIAFLFRLLGFLTGVSAITLQFVTNSIVGKGFMANHTLAYFTLQTNIFTTLIFLTLLIKALLVRKRDGQWETVQINRSLHLACTFYITITMTVYWAVLAPMLGVGNTPLTICNTLFLHLFTPLFAIIDCLLFYEHGTLTRKDAFRWLAYPVLYVIMLFAIACLSDVPYYKFPMGDELIPLMYPYPFLDPQIVGVWGTVGVMAALLILSLGFGWFYIFVDNRIARRIRQRDRKSVR